jgi:hypothetical protein
MAAASAVCPAAVPVWRAGPEIDRGIGKTSSAVRRLGTMTESISVLETKR